MMNQDIQSSPPNPSDQPKILIIDDDPTIRETLSEMIRFLNFQVDGAASGEVGLKLYRSSLARLAPFDLVITDMAFPDGMNGEQILAEIRHLAPEAKVIVSSGFSSPSDLSRYEKSGFSGFLSKPFGLKALQQSIQKVLTE